MEYLSQVFDSCFGPLVYLEDTERLEQRLDLILDVTSEICPEARVIYTEPRPQFRLPLMPRLNYNTFCYYDASQIVQENVKIKTQSRKRCNVDRVRKNPKKSLLR